MPNCANRKPVSVTPDPQLERSLRLALATGLALVALLPMARASSEWLGWLPLWLGGMPAVHCGLARFRLPLRTARAGAQSRPRRRRTAQARRRAMPALAQLPRAA